jgi:hypothetical protein
MRLLLLGHLFPLLFVGQPAAAQIERGSVGVVYLSNERIVMASDSRGVTGVLDSSPTDGECKIATMGGEFISVFVGALRYVRTGPNDKSPEWSSAGDLRAAYDRVAARGKIRKPIDVIANAWGTAIQARFTAGYGVSPQEVRDLAATHGGALARGMFGGFDAAGKLALVDVRVTLALSPGSLPAYQATRITQCPWNDYCGIGHTEIVTEFAMLASKRAIEESATRKPPIKGLDSTTARAISLVELTELYQTGPKTVGGPVDAISLRTGGSVRWLARKPGCPAN